MMNPTMRLKLKGDTFFLPDESGGMYFRNNEGSFRMEGKSVQQWIEQLVPVFNGQRSLGELTDGLPDRYAERVYEIAMALLDNGFVRDVSQDRLHSLSDAILEHYAAQIEFLDNLAGSGAYRFSQFRETKVLAVGAGSILCSLVAALFESGLPKLNTIITDVVPTNRDRLAELARFARESDAEVELTETTCPIGVDGWRETVQPYDAVLFVSQASDIDELERLESICNAEQKLFIPALCLDHVGLAGPVIGPGRTASFMTVWHRIHQDAIEPPLSSSGYAYAPTAGSILANMLAFELFKTITGVVESELGHQFYLLNIETLEGALHTCLPEPTVAQLEPAKLVDDLPKRLEASIVRSLGELLPYFGQLTDAKTGVFHVWDEDDLVQLPLAQCRVQVVNPMSDGPAKLLPEITCVGLTHEDARREAGFVGIEDYVSRLIPQMMPSTFKTEEHAMGEMNIAAASDEFVGVGVGASVAEAVWRGLQTCILNDMANLIEQHEQAITPVEISSIDDERCRFYLQVLGTMDARPVIGLGEAFGLPMVWVGINGRYHGRVEMSVTAALQRVLEHVIAKVAANEHMIHGATMVTKRRIIESSSVELTDEAPRALRIEAMNGGVSSQALLSAIQLLQQKGRQMFVFDLAVEPFLNEVLAGVFGVLLRREESL